MEPQNDRLKHALIHGAITGGVIAIYLLLIYMFGMYNNPTLTSFPIALFLLGGFISAKRYRDRMPGRPLNFGQMYGVTFLTFLFAGVVWAIYGYLLYKFSPELLDAKYVESQEALLQLGWTEDRVAMMTTRPTPFSLAFVYLFYAALGGAISALIIAGILRRPVNPLLTNDE